MTSALPTVSGKLHRSRPDASDRVFAESDGLIDGYPTSVKITHKGLYLTVLRNGEELWFGVNLSDLARDAAQAIERHLQGTRGGA